MFVIGVLLVVIVVIKGIIIPCFSFMLTLMNNVEKDAATRTNTGKTEKETRPNQPAREPSPPSSSELIVVKELGKFAQVLSLLLVIVISVN